MSTEEGADEVTLAMLLAEVRALRALVAPRRRRPGRPEKDFALSPEYKAAIALVRERQVTTCTEVAKVTKRTRANAHIVLRKMEAAGILRVIARGLFVRGEKFPEDDE